MAKADTEGLEQVLGQIVGVRDVLKKMCQVSVTRTSLRSAVREALLPMIQEHRDELFPEIAELSKRLASGDDGELDLLKESAPSAPASLPDDFVEKLESFEARIEKLAGLESKFQQDLSQLDMNLSQLGKRVSTREVESQEKLDEMKASLDEELQNARLSIEEKVEKVQEYLGRLETSIPETAHAAAGEVESRLRQEIETMVEQLSGQLKDVQQILERMEEFVPRKEMLASLDSRLANLESGLANITGKIEGIESIAPEVRGLPERFAELRQQVADASRTLGEATDEAKNRLASRLDELQDVLKDGITRWESDQTETQHRLTSVRDTLRDQLSGLAHQVDKEKASLWSKIGGNKEKGLKLSSDAFEDLSSKLEGIIGGLEGIITRQKG